MPIFNICSPNKNFITPTIFTKTQLLLMTQYCYCEIKPTPNICGFKVNAVPKSKKICIKTTIHLRLNDHRGTRPRSTESTY